MNHKSENIKKNMINTIEKKEKSENRGSISGNANILAINTQKKNNKEQEMYKKIENSLNKDINRTNIICPEKEIEMIL